MAMNHENTEENTREWPARAMDLQQEPAIPDDVIWPPGAEKPDKAIPKESAGAEKVPANGDARKAVAKKAVAEKVEKRPAPAADVEARKPAEKKTARKS